MTDKNQIPAAAEPPKPDPLVVPETDFTDGMTLSAEDVDRLTPGELEFLQNPDADVEDAEIVQDDATDTTADTPEADKKPDADPAEAEIAAAAAAALAPPEATPSPAPAAAPELVDLEPMEQKLTQVNAASKDLMAKWDSGEISEAEFAAQEAQNLADRDEVVSQIALAKAANSTAEVELKRQGELEQEQKDAAVKTVLDYKAEFPELFSEKHLEGFDRVYLALANLPANVSKTESELLSLAHKAYSDAVAGTDNALVTAKPGQPGVGKRPTDPPPSIEELAVDGDGVNTSGWAQLSARIDREDDPDEIERLMAQVPPHQRDEFASFQAE